MENHRVKDKFFNITLFVLISSFVFFIYYQAVDGPMVLDDQANIVFNEGIKIDDLSAESLYESATSMKEVFTSRHPLLNRPVSYLSYGLNYLFSENFYRSIKTTNIFLHLLCGLLLFCFIRQLTEFYQHQYPSGDTAAKSHVFREKMLSWLPLIASAGWLLHPLMVSTVLYSVQRMTILSAGCLLLGLNLYIYYRVKLLSLNKGFWVGLVGVLLMTLVAFLCKENGALLPLYCLVVELCFFRFNFHPQTGLLLRRFYLVLLILPVIILFSYLTNVYLSTDAQGLLSYRQFDLDMRLLTQARILWEYLYWLILPVPENLTFIHDTLQISQSLLQPVTTLLAVAGWFVLSIVMLHLLRQNKHPFLTFGFFWFLAGHLLESSVLPLELVFEHRNYLPYAGPIMAVLYYLLRGVSKLNVSTGFAVFLAGFIVTAVPALLTTERVRHWRSEQQLVEHWLQVNAESPRVWAKTADYFYRNRNLAATFLSLSNGLNFASWEAGYGFAQLGIMCTQGQDLNSGRGAEVHKATMNALRQKPTTAYSVNQYRNMINLCTDLNQIKSLQDLHYEAAAQKKSQMVSGANYMFALLALAEQQPDKARVFLVRVLKADPFSQEAKDLIAQIDGDDRHKNRP